MAEGKASHVYAATLAGKEQTITFTPAAGTAASAKFTPTAGSGGGLDFTLAEEPGDSDRRTVRVTVTNPAQGKTYQVQWEQGGAWSDLPATGTPAHSMTHKYPAAGTFPVTVQDKANPTTSKTQQATVPFGGGGTQPVLTVAPTANNPMSADLTVTNWDAIGRAGMINWGDGQSEPVPSSSGGRISHGYSGDQAGKPQTITFTTSSNATATATFTPQSGGGGGPVEITVAEEPGDTDRRTVRASVTNAATGRTYEVQWQQNGPWADLPATGNPAHSATHKYTAAGTYPVTVRDKATPTNTTTQQITVPFGGGGGTIQFTLAEEPGDQARRTVRATVTSPQQGKTYQVQWQANGAWSDLLATGTPPHSGTTKYAAAGTYAVSVRDKADPVNVATQQVTVPLTGGGGTPPTITTAADPANPMTVQLTVTNFDAIGRAGLVNWGDGATEQLDAASNGKASHAYPDALAGQPQTITFTADNQSQPATVTFTPTEGGGGTLAFTLAEEPGDTNRRTVRATVTEPAVGATYQIQWQQNGPWADLPATGSPAHSATHKYAAAGTYPVVVRDKANPSNTATQQATVPFTGGGGGTDPTITVTAAPDDPMTADLTVTNWAQVGQAGTVDWGDGQSEQLDAASNGQASHTYPPAQAGVEVTVKFTAANGRAVGTTFTPQTGGGLDFTLAEEPGDTDRRTVRATVTNPQQGTTYEIQWEGGAWADLPSDGTPPASGTHKYAVEGTYQVVVRDKANPDTSKTQQVTVPFTNGNGARARRANGNGRK